MEDVLQKSSLMKMLAVMVRAVSFQRCAYVDIIADVAMAFHRWMVAAWILPICKILNPRVLTQPNGDGSQ